MKFAGYRPAAWRLVRRGIIVLTIVMLLAACGTRAQNDSVQKQVFTLNSAVEYALAHYPSVRASLERQAAANAGIGVARTNYLPRADALWQTNFATHNDFFGLLFPQNVVPSVSGPVLPVTAAGAWDSAAGLLVSWEPFDFGYRAGVVSQARANAKIYKAGVALTRLDVASATVSAFFNLFAAQQLVQAAQADVERRQVFANTVQVLVENQLRPGADGSRAQAGLAAARIRLIRAETSERVASAAFAELLGVPSANVSIDAAALVGSLPKEDAAPPLTIANHPAALVQNAQISVVAAQIHVLDRSYYPHFLLESSISGRGSGVNDDGSLQGGVNGFGPNRENWAVGVTATFPIMDIFSIRAKKQVAEANLKAQQAAYQQTVQELSSHVEQARISEDGARKVAQNTPIEEQAARDSESQSRARYQSGLTGIVDVADGQSLLAQAEITDIIAKLEIWRSMIAVAISQGDVQAILQLTQNAGGH
jgi:outer membrane protein TolC